MIFELAPNFFSNPLCIAAAASLTRIVGFKSVPYMLLTLFFTAIITNAKSSPVSDVQTDRPNGWK